MRKSASYTLPAVDEGKAAKARVSFTHDGVNAFTVDAGSVVGRGGWTGTATPPTSTGRSR